MKDNLILDESKSFAVRMIRMYQYLSKEKKEFVLSKQALRSGTSIGANVREAVQAQSRNDCSRLNRILISIVKSSRNSIDD